MILLILSPLCACCQFYIAPSPDLCPGGEDVANRHCLTIEQFAASADLNLGSNVILELVPGNHTLESELFISEDVTDFMMHSTNASVLCSGTNASITLEQVRNIRISGVSFAACAPVKVSSVETFSLNDSSFQVNGTIIISNTLDATIMRSSFQNNALGSRVYWSGSIPPDDIIECCSSGGVHAFNSSLQIHQSVFFNNFSYITGGVYSVNSNITIMDSIFNQNCEF